jgi:hypothetical protein
MAKSVLVECYQPDGGSYAFRTTLAEWKKTIPILGQMLGPNGVFGQQFYLVWRTQKRWDGARRKTLVRSLTPKGMSLEFRKVPSRCCGDRYIPVLTCEE